MKMASFIRQRYTEGVWTLVYFIALIVDSTHHHSPSSTSSHHDPSSSSPYLAILGLRPLRRLSVQYLVTSNVEEKYAENNFQVN